MPKIRKKLITEFWEHALVTYVRVGPNSKVTGLKACDQICKWRNRKQLNVNGNKLSSSYFIYMPVGINFKTQFF